MNESILEKSKAEYILIIDDNPHNLQVLGKLLIENGYRSEFATNGEGALEWISKRLFDLILLDINMPGMNGFEVCIKIRSNCNFDKTPIIFLSAETDRESILKGFELGAQDYVTKPFDARELLSRVKTHLSLKCSLEKLENQNLILEAKVTERTAQLNDANEQLNHLNLKLLELDKAKSEFLRLVSHEIRTPLNGIIGPIELLKESEASRELGELIEILDLSVKRLEKFSLNALLITRLQTKQTYLNKQLFSPAEIIYELIAIRNEIIDKKALSMTMFKKSEDLNINGETELIKICFENILDNSIEHVPDNGNITVDIYNADDFIICEFTDNGPGFNEVSQKEIFEFFSMGDSKNDGSNGIGLPLCKLIMQAHSGEIHVGNNPGGGAFVKLLFKH